jgi:multisubunit Na+/H+ antiporter MnhF subunit
MISENSPMEYLEAFAIVALVSVLSTVGLLKYIEKIKRGR